MKATLPKLAKDIAALVGIARRETSVEKIEAALAEGRAKVEAATRAHDDAQRAYEAGLLDETPEALARLQDRKAAAGIERDRSEALVRALENRLEQARADAERSARKAAHDDAVQKADAIKDRFAAEYAHHAGAIRGLLADLAAAEIAAKRANDVAAEFGYIPRVEDTIRSALSAPEEIVSTEEVELWCIDGRTDPLPADRQDDVRPRGNRDERRGLLPGPADSFDASPWECTRRRYRRIAFREAVPVSMEDGLLQAVHLPAVHHLGENFVTAERTRGVDTALAHLSAERAPDPVVTRTIVPRFELIPEESATHETIVPYPKREPDPPPRTPSAREIRREHTPSRLMASERQAG